MQRPLWISLLIVFLAGCGGGDSDHGHSHKDHDHHDHKDHGHKDHGHDPDHDHTGPNAHFWLDPVLAKQFIDMAWPAVGEAIATAKQAGRKAVIVASIFPVASLVSELAGEDAVVTTMLPQGGSPHGFEITPDVLRAVSGADLVVIVGLSLDPWAEKAIKSAKNAPKGIRFAELVEQYQDGKEQPVPADHPLAGRVKTMGDKLVALHEKHKAELGKLVTKELVTFHNAFDLLAERYGLKVVAHLTEMDLPSGAEVTPTSLIEARDAVKKFKLKTLYAEPAYPDAALHAIAEATGVKVLRLDDLGGPDREGYRGYFEMMESNLKVLVEGQSR